MSKFIERSLQSQKGVHIPNFGTFSFVQKKLDVGNAKYLLIQRPVFQLFERICQTHGLGQTKHHVTGSVPVVQLNYAALSVESTGRFDRDKIETCVRETLGALNRSIAMQRNVELVFCGLGRLQIRGGHVKFKFYKDFVNSLDRSGTVVRAMQQRPGTADSVMTDRPASRAFSVALPKLPSRGANGLAPINEDEDYAMGEAAGVQTDRREVDFDLEAAGGYDEEPQRPCTERQSTGRQSALPVAMATDFSYDLATARRSAAAAAAANSVADRLDLRNGDSEAEAAAAADAADADTEADKENYSRRIAEPSDQYGKPDLQGSSLPPPTPPQMPLPPPRPPSTARLQSQQQQQQRPPSTASSCGHAGAGQELCYVCHQRARRNIPVSFAEELKRREQEEDQLLHAYNEMRDKERILKEQESLLAKRHDAQKVSAFNLGVSEAQKERRAQRDDDTRPSYIFQARPLTPPRRIKQMALNADLERQVTDKRSAHDRHRADEAFLERLEQVQLAEDLAAQREQYLKDREEQKEMYRRALSAQLRYKPVPLPPREPDSSEPVFGRNDVTEEKLLERRRRAKEVAISQLDDVTAKKREELLRRLQEQKYEEDVLRRTRDDLVRDRAWRFDRMQRNRQGLEADWSQAAQVKRDRELAEKLRASSPGGLVHEQCDNNRRCRQCKRRLNNSGETNIWCESYYVPGSRYLT